MSKQYVNKNDVQIKNREINFKYEIIEKLECGIELKGTEVKSIRDGMCNLKDSFALIRNNEILLKNMHMNMEIYIMLILQEIENFLYIKKKY